MNKIFVFFLCLLSSLFVQASCFTENETSLIMESLPSKNDEYYDNFPYGRINNIVNCDKKTELSNLVCNIPELKKALLLLAIGEIYAYENATKSPVPDYATYNDDITEWVNEIIKNQTSKEIAIRKLCYIIKKKLSDDFGGDFYYNPAVHEVLASKSNKNGIMIENISSIFYLGKSCDATDGNKSKGKWYIDRNSDQFVIELNDKTYRFYHDDNAFSLNCERPNK
ncbi:hypothetical protein [Peptostreptococcus porci]|uniref:hypothetical protein n=1 Tax=Peptostreptococcus porci TaxID=2652282 RepID=UPI002A91A734|nr:hypothetical protein [Peptostreptococcus porci]MDY5436491.1 hypothetical protein [Peptostreptococcus porci]